MPFTVPPLACAPVPKAAIDNALTFVRRNYRDDVTYLCKLPAGTGGFVPEIVALEPRSAEGLLERARLLTSGHLLLLAGAFGPDFLFFPIATFDNVQISYAQPVTSASGPPPAGAPQPPAGQRRRGPRGPMVAAWVIAITH